MSEKILIAEISDNTTWYDYFPFYQNVWLVRTDNIYSDLADAEFELTNIGLESDIAVISFSVRKENYTRVTTVAQVIATQKTFYFNTDDNTLLIHFESHKPFYYWGTTELEIGFALGFYASPSDAKADWNDMQYYPRLEPFSLLGEKKDDQFFSKQSLQGNTIEINNHDLRFKNFAIGAGVGKRLGNFVRTLIWTGDDASTAAYSDFNIVFQGVIEKIREGKIIKIDLRDIRSSLKTKSPTRYLDTTNFPDIKDPDKNYLMPQLWGKCFEVPTIPLNENVNDVSGSAAYQFLICDTENHTLATTAVQKVYINNKETALTPTVLFNTTQNFAYIEIAAANFAVSRDGSATVDYENMDKVTLDINGYLKGVNFRESDGALTSSPTDLIENGLAILRQILLNNYGYDYIAALYDISTWESFEDAAYEVGYYLDKPISTQKQIEELAAAQLGQFIWNEDLKFSFDNDDFVSYEMEIPKYKLFPRDYFPTFTVDGTKVLATFRVGYKKKWDVKGKDDEESHDWIVNNSNEETALVNYNSTYARDFPTLINNQTDAQAYAVRVLEFGGISQDTFTIKTEWAANTLKAGEWVRVEADYGVGEYVGWSKCQILEVSPKIDTWEVELKLRLFKYLNYLTNTSGDYILDAEGRNILVETD